MMYALDTEKMTAAKERSGTFHGAALLDEKGNEIPITEKMIQDALKALETDVSPWQKGVAIVQE